MVQPAEALGQPLFPAPGSEAPGRRPAPARAAKRQFRLGRSSPQLISVVPLPRPLLREWEGEDAAEARARSALQLVCVREWEAAGLRLWPSRLTASTPQPQS